MYVVYKYAAMDVTWLSYLIFQLQIDVEKREQLRKLPNTAGLQLS